MRDIIESKAWDDAGAEIPVVLGQDVTGKPMVLDLTKMPHVLIAGSTGSGKTVCINAVIASLLYHSGPEDLRFIMVDPKVVEMQMYNSLPHMLIPVVTEAKKVPAALKWLIAEMEHRYQIFAKTNVRNIAGFNAKLLKDKAEQAKAEAMESDMSPEERNALQQVEVPRDDDAFEIPRKKLPYIVCIIDELADLMMVAPADIETCIARIAQLARAAGIHLILATQRPSVNVITGVIKANLPSRISFKVASKIDSRTILDGGGAEALIGKGDMLFILPALRIWCAPKAPSSRTTRSKPLSNFLKRITTHQRSPKKCRSKLMLVAAMGQWATTVAPLTGTNSYLALSTCFADKRAPPQCFSAVCVLVITERLASWRNSKNVAL